MSEITTIPDALALIDDTLIHAHASGDAPTIDALVAELAERLNRARALASVLAR